MKRPLIATVGASLICLASFALTVQAAPPAGNNATMPPANGQASQTPTPGNSAGANATNNAPTASQTSAESNQKMAPNQGGGDQATQSSASGSQFANPVDRLSYAIGMDMAANLQSQGVAINPDQIVRGIKDQMAGKTLLTKEQASQALLDFQKQLIAKQAQKFKAVGQKNAQAGADFLAANKSKPGVKTLPSGVQYKILTAGKGTMPKADDTVIVNYEGKLINGKVFDSSYKRGKPVTFKVSQVIPGWQEALTHMKAGATWEVYIPAKLAYGARGAGGLIGPNETLIFKIHLISIQPSNKQN